MSEKKRFIAKFWYVIGTLLVGGAVLISINLLSHRHDRLPYEHGRIADVSWQEGTNPFTIDSTVTDTNGLPLAGAELNFINNSGGNRVTTDEKGHARVVVSERDLERIVLDGAVVLDRPRAYWLNYPNVQKGLRVKIIVKRREVTSGPK